MERIAPEKMMCGAVFSVEMCSGHKLTEKIRDAILSNPPIERISITTQLHLGEIDLIAELISKSTRTRIIIISGTQLPEFRKVYESIVTNRSLEYLRIVRSNPIRDVFSYIQHIRRVDVTHSSTNFDVVLSEHSAIELLDLSKNNISDLKGISEMLKSNRSIKKLYLDTNGITTLNDISQALRVNTTLETISFFSNPINNIRCFCDAMKENTTVQYAGGLYWMGSHHSDWLEIDAALARNRSSLPNRNAKLFGLMLDDCKMHGWV